MAFVREELSREDLKKYNIEYDDCWYIDRERGLLFYYRYGNGRGREKIFRLIWKGKNIEVASAQHSLGTSEDTLVDEWRQTYFGYEGARTFEEAWVAEDREEIAQVVIELLTMFSTRNFKNKRVKVFFNPRMNITEPTIR